METSDPLLETLQKFPSRLLMAIHGIAEEDLRIAEREGAWSILDVIAHLGDFELLTGWRLRLIVTIDRPALPRLEQDALVRALHRGRKKASLVRELTQLRWINLDLVKRLGEDQLGRTGLHPEYGALSVLQLLERAVAHQEKHLGQIERIATGHAMRREPVDARGAESAPVTAATPREVGPGLRVRDLWRDGQRAAQYVEIGAGARYPRVDHHVPGAEEAFVVRGTFHDGIRDYPAGTFVHYPAGSSHVPQSGDGCELFLFYPEG